MMWSARPVAHLLNWVLGTLIAAVIFAFVFGLSLLTGPGDATNDDFGPVFTALFYTVVMIFLALPWSFCVGSVPALTGWLTRDRSPAVMLSAVFLTAAISSLSGLHLATGGAGIFAHHQVLFSVMTVLLAAVGWSALALRNLRASLIPKDSNSN